MAATSLTVPAAVLSAIALGSHKCTTVGGHHLIIYKGPDGKLRVAPNKCQHMGGSFSTDVEDAAILKCGFHSWKLNPATMTYGKGGEGSLLYWLRLAGRCRMRLEMTLRTRLRKHHRWFLQWLWRKH